MDKDSKKGKKSVKKSTNKEKENKPKSSKENKKEEKKYKIKKKSRAKRTIKIVLLTLLFVILIVSGVVVGKIYGAIKSAKLSMEDIVIQYENSVVKDLDGNVIAELSGDENRKVVTLSEMSPYIPKAFVAIEDERFYNHHGVDIKRTAAATFKYALSKIGIGSASYGGSTITQQLVKNLTKDDERSAERKIKEMARAYYLEKELSKPQVLELYLNMIFLGGKASGVEVASNYYFSKSAKDLTLIESAFLAGINDGPNYYSPFSEDEADKERIKNRVRTVIDKMYELGQEDPSHKAAITKEEHDNAIKELEETGIVFQEGKITSVLYSYHTDATINQVKKDLKEKHSDWTDEYIDYYVKSGGLTIYSTQNTSMQQLMEEEAKKDKYIITSKTQIDDDGNYKTAQAAMVLMDHKSGYVLATIGGLGEKTTAFGQNRATQTTRSTGSSIKPLAVVAPGIDKGIITAATVFDDIQYFSGQYATFKDYGNSFRGLITVRYAIAYSQNIPMLKGINRIGIQTSMDFLKSVGITTLDDEEDATMVLTLGGMKYGVSPLELAGAYSAIANDGVYIEPTFYKEVVDSDGKTVLTPDQETRTVMSSAAAYIVKEVLTEVVRSGAGGYTAIPGISVAAKTGTSQDDNDRWYCGFTPYYTATTWFGYDKPETVVYPGNANPAGKMWDAIMETIHEGLPSARFSDTMPNGVTTKTVCKSSGLLATDLCSRDPRGNQVYTEYFVRGTEPTTYCTCHVERQICNDTGLLATEYCPNKSSRVYITRPETETGNWQGAADAAYMLTVTNYCTTHTKAPEPEPPAETETPEKPDTSGGTTKPGNNTTGNNTTNNNTTNNNKNNTTNNNATNNNKNNTTNNNATNNNKNNTTNNNATNNRRNNTTNNNATRNN